MWAILTMAKETRIMGKRSPPSLNWDQVICENKKCVEKIVPERILICRKRQPARACTWEGWKESGDEHERVSVQFHHCSLPSNTGVGSNHTVDRTRAHHYGPSGTYAPPSLVSLYLV